MANTCRWCASPIILTASDQAILAKVTPEIAGVKQFLPEPTLCGTCQHQLRMAFRNQQTLYDGKCDQCSKDIISLFSPNRSGHVYCSDCWWSDSWDAMHYARDFDFSRSFTEQFRELVRSVPKVALLNWRGENSAYCNYTYGNKNCYLVFGGDFNQDCYYGTLCMHNENSLDLNFSDGNQLCYGLQDSHDCYSSSSLVDCRNVSDSAFCSDCTGCSECILCTNLINRSYCIENVQYSREEYYRRKAVLLNGSHATWQLMQQRFAALRSQRIVKYAHITASEDCTGDYVQHSKACLNSYDIQNGRDLNDLVFGMKSTDCLQSSMLGEGSELCYNVLSAIKSSRIVASLVSIECSDLLYCYNLINCRNCFGCFGLSHKEFYIFNRQYSPEEYGKLVGKIIAHMRSTGEWGEFMHPSLALFGYDESYAQTNYPLSHEEALHRGFNWSGSPSPIPRSGKVIQSSQLPDSILHIPDTIANYAIECEVTGKPFRIIPQELRFYREHNLPLPRRHPDVRNLDRLGFRNPRKLYERPCMNCSKPVMTTYAPNRTERMYCEECYVKAVY